MGELRPTCLGISGHVPRDIAAITACPGHRPHPATGLVGTTMRADWCHTDPHLGPAAGNVSWNSTSRVVVLTTCASCSAAVMHLSLFCCALSFFACTRAIHFVSNGKCRCTCSMSANGTCSNSGSDSGSRPPRR